jgi:Putative sensor
MTASEYPGQAGTRHADGARAADDARRLRLRRNPLRLAVSAAPWTGALYLAGYLLVGWVLFAIAVTSASVAAVFAITLAGLPLLIACAGVVRGCANFERARLRTAFTRPVKGRYRTPTRPGLIAQVSTRWKDPATWRDLAYLVGLWVPFFILDTVVVTVWLTFLAGLALPAWYWAPRNDFNNGVSAHGVPLGYFPNGPHGPGGVGLFVDTLPKALLAAAGFLVLFLLFNYVLVATYAAHARSARALLRPPADPLAEAKEVLTTPGPLSRLIPNGWRGQTRAR